MSGLGALDQEVCQGIRDLKTVLDFNRDAFGPEYLSSVSCLVQLNKRRAEAAQSGDVDSLVDVARRVNYAQAAANDRISPQRMVAGMGDVGDIRAWTKLTNPVKARDYDVKDRLAEVKQTMQDWSQRFTKPELVSMAGEHAAIDRIRDTIDRRYKGEIKPQMSKEAALKQLDELMGRVRLLQGRVNAIASGRRPGKAVTIATPAPAPTPVPVQVTQPVVAPAPVPLPIPEMAPAAPALVQAPQADIPASPPPAASAPAKTGIDLKKVAIWGGAAVGSAVLLYLGYSFMKNKAGPTLGLWGDYSEASR